MTGQAPAHHHRLLLELGRGGMGVVYLARIDRGAATELIVVKQLKSDLAKDPEFRQMLIEEARIATRLSHPNVVRTLEAGFDGRHHFIAMELLEGQPFDALVRSPNGALPPALAVFVIERVLAGLHAAHELADADGTPLDVVHRDVSPHNVLVTYDGDVKVLDFGIAKAADSSQRTRTGVVKGKATYMAPEQAARGRIDRRADVFAVGVMLWEAIAKQRFWGDLSEQEILARLQRGEITRAEVAMPASIAAICSRATSAKPDDRFPTAEAMRAALVESHADGGAARDDLAQFVSRAFADERAQLAAEIASVVERDAPVEPIDEDDVPVRGFSRTYALKLGADGETPPSQSAATNVGRRSSVATIALVAAVAIGGVALAAIATRKPATITSASGSASSATTNGCSANAQCASAHRDAPFVCRTSDRTCVAIESVDCKVHAAPGDVASDDAIWIGAMFPLSGEDAARFGTARNNAVDLARREFVEVAHGIAGTGGSRRPIAVVTCDDAVDSARAARHLIDDVRVAAIIGSPSNDARALARDGHVLVVGDAPPPIATVVSDLFESKVRAMPGRARKDDVARVALVHDDGGAARALAQIVGAALRLGGKSAAEQPSSFRDFTYRTTSVDQAPLVSEIAMFAPDIVIALGEPMMKAIVLPLEAAWRAAPARPYWIATTPWTGDDFVRFVGKSAERRRRFFSVVPAVATPSNARFVLRYNEAFTPDVTRATSPVSSYDAFYLLAYGAAAAGDGALDDAAFTRGFARLAVAGRSIDVGPSSIFEALDALQRGAAVDLAGASGPLRFDAASGAMTQSFMLTCTSVVADGNAGDAVESGVSVDAVTKRVQGSLKCP